VPSVRAVYSRPFPSWPFRPLKGHPFLMADRVLVVRITRLVPPFRVHFPMPDSCRLLSNQNRTCFISFPLVVFSLTFSPLRCGLWPRLIGINESSRCFPIAGGLIFLVVCPFLNNRCSLIPQFVDSPPPPPCPTGSNKKEILSMLWVSRADPHPIFPFSDFSERLTVHFFASVFCIVGSLFIISLFWLFRLSRDLITTRTFSLAKEKLATRCFVRDRSPFLDLIRGLPV